MRSIALKSFNFIASLKTAGKILLATTKFMVVMIPIYILTCLYAIFIALAGVAESGSTAETEKRVSYQLGQDLTKHTNRLITWTGISDFDASTSK